MKKVLALVLAVIMVCTMAMAVEVITIDSSKALIVSSDDNLAKITLDPNKVIDFTDTYYLQVPTEFFALLGDDSIKGDKAYYGEYLTVSGLNGGFNAKNLNEYFIPVKVADKPLDNAVDLTLGAFTIKKDAKNYVSFKVVDNAFVIDKLVKGDMEVTGTALATAKDGLKNVVLNANYDIGFAVTKLYNKNENTGKTELYNMTNAADGWYYNNSSKATEVTLHEEGNDKVTLTVGAKKYFYFETVAAGTPDSTYELTKVTDTGYVVSEGTIEYKIAADNGSNDLYYAVNKDGKVYTAGLTFVKETNALGAIKGYWTLKTSDYQYGIYQGTKALNVSDLPGTTTPTTPGTTTNPGTGANDVVGVAAALAVVALVSGAAISLKK